MYQGARETSPATQKMELYYEHEHGTRRVRFRIYAPLKLVAGRMKLDLCIKISLSREGFNFPLQMFRGSIVFLDNVVL